VDIVANDAAAVTERIGPRLPLRPLAVGLSASVGLLALYLGIITIAQDWAHAVQQLAEDRWFVAAILAGFGTQAGLFMYLRGLHSQVTAAGVAASTGTATEPLFRSAWASAAWAGLWGSGGGLSISIIGIISVGVGVGPCARADEMPTARLKLAARSSKLYKERIRLRDGFPTRSLIFSSLMLMNSYLPPRSLGSSTSRRASPSRFHPKTKSTNARPGQATMYQYVPRLVIQERAKLSNWPQSA